MKRGALVFDTIKKQYGIFLRYADNAKEWCIINYDNSARSYIEAEERGEMTERCHLALILQERKR